MNLASGTSWSSTVLAVGIDIVMKATWLIVIVLLIQFVLGRRRAVLGSAVGNAGLVGLLLLPFSALVLPDLTIACLPTARSTRRAGAGSVPDAPARGVPVRGVFEEAITNPSVLGQPRAESQVEASLVREADTKAPVLSSTHSAVTRVAPAATKVTWSLDWAVVAIIGYAVVALALFARLGGSLWAVAKLRQTCEPFTNTEWTGPLERWRRRLGIRRDVVLAWSPRVGVPIVLGWLRPTIVLPAVLTGPDSGGHVDAVLLHELSHVRRGDYAWNVLLSVVQALYWPHVLVWVLGRSIAEVRERACDDLCVYEMGGSSAYRETLLTMATVIVRGPWPTLGLAMARPSKLGRRLAQIERSRGDERCLLRWPARLVLGTLAITLAGSLGAIQLVRREARATVLDESQATPKAAAPAVPAPAGGVGRVFHLQVVAADTGEPVANADVRLWISLRDDWRKTDDRGRLDITYATGPSDRSFSIDVWGKGRAMQRHHWGNDPNQPVPDGASIKLQPGESLGGIAQDEQGRPIAWATISLWSHNYQKKDPHELLYDLRAVTDSDGRWQTSGAPTTNGELRGFRIVHPEFLSSRGYLEQELVPKIADLRASKAVTVMKKGVPIEGRVLDADDKPVIGARVLSSDRKDALFGDVEEFVVTTDAEGRFRTGQVKAGEWFLVALANGHGPGEQRAKIGTAVPQVEIKLGRPRPFRGRVVDPSGAAIAGAFVNPDTWRGHRDLGAYFWTDADGRFRWDDAPDDELLVNVNQEGYRGLFQQRIAPSGEEVVFTLQPSVSIRGTVRDAETKKRVDSATVEYGVVDPKTGEPTTWTGMPATGFSTRVYQGDLNVDIPVADGPYKIRVRSPGFETFVSRTFRREEKVVTGFDIDLVPGKPAGRKGTVLRPDGKPLAGGRVYSTQLNEGLNVDDRVVQGRGISSNGREELTDNDGSFAIPEYDKSWVVLILGDDAYAIASKEAIDKSPEIQAQAYGRVEGRYHVGSRAAANKQLELAGLIQDRSTMFCTIFLKQSAKTDQDGRFVFEKVIPVNGLRVARQGRREGPGRMWSLGEPVRVEPGRTVMVTVGGKGRPVVGRVEPPQSWRQPVDFTDRSSATIESNRPLTPYPLSLFRGKTALNGKEWSDWMHRWRESAEGRDYADRRVAASVALAPDGSFRIDDVPPGEYRLALRVNEEHANRDPGPFARIIQVFTVPPVPGGQSDEPLDLGALRLRPKVKLEVGDPAPDVVITTLEGKRLAVPGDFKNQYLLLDFGTIWDSQSAIQITRLNDLNQRFARDPRFAILSLISAVDDAESRKFVEEKGEAWPQAIIGPLANSISSAYGVNDENVPALILIGPDGKVVAKDLRYDKLGKVIDDALGGR